jgi:hypothetical protein
MDGCPAAGPGRLGMSFMHGKSSDRSLSLFSNHFTVGDLDVRGDSGTIEEITLARHQARVVLMHHNSPYRSSQPRHVGLHSAWKGCRDLQINPKCSHANETWTMFTKLQQAQVLSANESPAGKDVVKRSDLIGPASKQTGACSDASRRVRAQVPRGRCTAPDSPPTFPPRA